MSKYQYYNTKIINVLWSKQIRFDPATCITYADNTTETFLQYFFEIVKRTVLFLLLNLEIMILILLIMSSS